MNAEDYKHSRFGKPGITGKERKSSINQVTQTMGKKHQTLMGLPQEDRDIENLSLSSINASEHLITYRKRPSEHAVGSADTSVGRIPLKTEEISTVTDDISTPNRSNYFSIFFKTYLKNYVSFPVIRFYLWSKINKLTAALFAPPSPTPSILV